MQPAALPALAVVLVVLVVACAAVLAARAVLLRRPRPVPGRRAGRLASLRQWTQRLGRPRSTPARPAGPARVIPLDDARRRMRAAR
jgi:hypothetical protein